MVGPSTEAGVVKSIVNAVQQQYPSTWFINVHGSGMQRAGTPDILLCIKGRFVALEVKHQKPGESDAAARGRTSKIQQIQIDRINAAGGLAATVLSAQETLELLSTELQL